MQNKKETLNFFIKLVLLCFMVIVNHTAVKARAEDSLAVIRRYITIGNAYRTIPVHVSIEIQNSANVILNSSDTTTEETEFYFYKEGSYIKTSNTVQLSNDSMMLFLQANIGQMFLYSGKTPASSIFNIATGQVQDSTVHAMAIAYHIDESSVQGDSGIIQVSSRMLVKGTNFPAATMKLTYNRINGLATSAVQTRRRLLKINPEAYDTYLQNPLYAGKIITMADGGHFLLVEKTARYIYRDILFNNNRPLPLKIFDCIEKNESGNYMPVSSFKQYSLKRR
jgi:hypothetical protein